MCWIYVRNVTFEKKSTLPSKMKWTLWKFMSLFCSQLSVELLLLLQPTNIPAPLYFNSFFLENDKWNPIDLAGSSKVFTCVKKTDELGQHKIPLFIFFLLSLLFWCLMMMVRRTAQKFALNFITAAALLKSNLLHHFGIASNRHCPKFQKYNG